ncbi:MAG: hypothetical protein VXX30_05085, partial [Planctomycetota bacterium]|nr:hypothetical protein [Planctomycetota bacterium]
MDERIADNLARRLDEMDAQLRGVGELLLDPEVLGDHHRVRELSVKRSALEGPVGTWRKVKALDTEQEELTAAVAANEDPEL